MAEGIAAMWRRVSAARMPDINAAVALYRDATGSAPLHVHAPGEVRMAARLDAGRSVEQAAAREIIYRICLAWQSQRIWLLPAGWTAGTEG